VSEFSTTYRLLVSAMQEGLGETSAGISNAMPGGSDKTATEVVDSAAQRNARDNFNQIFLAESLKKQMMFWHKMDQQFMFSSDKDKAKVIRIIGKDAIRYFQNYGLDAQVVPDEALEMLGSKEFEGVGINPDTLRTDAFPVEVDGETLPKFMMEPGGEVGHLLMEPNDLSGVYDYIPDIESMALPNQAEILNTKRQLIELAQSPATTQMLASEGYKVKFKDLLEDFLEQTGAKDADKYFEKLPEGGMNAGIDPTGGAAAQGIDPSQGMVGAPSMAGVNQAVPGI
jgi:hypothetical protein